MTPEQRKQIEELIACGDKATQGNIDTDQGDEVTSSDGTCLLAAPQYNPAPNFSNDAEFTALAFNSRPALKALVEENERYRKALCEIQEGTLRPAHFIAQQALKGTIHD